MGPAESYLVTGDEPLSHWIPVPLLAATVTLLVWSKLRKDRQGELLWKPVSSTLFVVIALLSLLTPTHRLWYSLGITAGLLLGLCGDMALMWRDKRPFLIGLVFFLLGHIAYAVLWTAADGFHAQDWISGAALLLLGAVVYVYLRPGLGSMRGPVLVYIVIICLMVNRAISTFFGEAFTLTQAWLLTVGASLFWLSDLLLAVNRFRQPFRLEALGLFLYYGGQALIALSASFFA